MTDEGKDFLATMTSLCSVILAILAIILVLVQQPRPTGMTEEQFFRLLNKATETENLRRSTRYIMYHLL